MFAFGARWRKFTLVVVGGMHGHRRRKGRTVGFGLSVCRNTELDKERPYPIALSGARPPPLGMPSDDLPGLPLAAPRESGGRSRSRVSGIRCMRAAGLLACASNRPHMRPIILPPQERQALRASRVSCVAFPPRRNLSRLSSESFARRPRGLRGGLGGRCPRPPAWRSDPHAPVAEGVVRTLGCGTLSTREGRAMAPPTDRDR